MSIDPEPAELVLFKLQRNEDESGVSGTGTVAYGLRFPEPNGCVALGWVAGHGLTSVAVYDDLDKMMKIHGHGGSTTLSAIDVIDCGGPS
jgi:hypothetical protein